MTRYIGPPPSGFEWLGSLQVGSPPEPDLLDERQQLPVRPPPGLSLRLYNPESHQWSLYYANSAGGTLSQPVIGELKNGRGELFSQEPFRGRIIFTRFVITNLTPDSWRYEQSFSEDGGKTWEVNWSAIDTRVKGGSTGVP